MEQENMVQSITKIQDKMHKMEINELNQKHQDTIDKLTNELTELKTRIENYESNNIIFENTKYDLVNFEMMEQLLLDEVRRGNEYRRNGNLNAYNVDRFTEERVEGYEFIFQLIKHLKDKFKHDESEKERVLNVSKCNINEVIKVQNLTLQKEKEEIQSDYDWAVRKKKEIEYQNKCISEENEKLNEQLKDFLENDYKSKYENINGKLKENEDTIKCINDSLSEIQDKYCDVDIENNSLKMKNSRLKLTIKCISIVVGFSLVVGTLMCIL